MEKIKIELTPEQHSTVMELLKTAADRLEIDAAGLSSLVSKTASLLAEARLKQAAEARELFNELAKY